jgi:naphthoate synthase
MDYPEISCRVEEAAAIITRRFLKQSFNADSAPVAGLGPLAFAGLELYTETAEAGEGRQAFSEKRAPDDSEDR